MIADAGFVVEGADEVTLPGLTAGATAPGRPGLAPRGARGRDVRPTPERGSECPALGASIRRRPRLVSLGPAGSPPPGCPPAGAGGD